MIQLSTSLSISILDGEAVLLDKASGQYFGLNAVGTRIFTLLQTLGNTEQVIEGLLEEFDVPEAVLRQDVDLFLKDLTRRKLLVVTP